MDPKPQSVAIFSSLSRDSSKRRRAASTRRCSTKRAGAVARG